MTSFDLSGSPLAILLRNSQRPIPPRNQLLLSEVWEVIAVDPSSRSTFVDRILRRWWCPRCPLQMRQSFGASLTPLRLVQHVPTFRPRHSEPRCLPCPSSEGQRRFRGRSAASSTDRSSRQQRLRLPSLREQVSGCHQRYEIP